MKAGACLPMDGDAPDGGVDDMTKLAYLHEPGVLHNLSLRYSLDEIYVSTTVLPLNQELLSYLSNQGCLVQIKEFPFT